MKLTCKKGEMFGKAYSVEYEKQAYAIKLDGEKEVFLEGNFFYHTKDEKTIIKFRPEEAGKMLQAILSKNDIQTFVETVEGTYAGIYIDKNNKKITVFGDKLKRKEVYYGEDENEIVVSTHLKDLQKMGRGYNQNCMISILYLYAPKKCTIYNNVFRLRYNETLEISNGALHVRKHWEEPLKIQAYDEGHLKKLMEILENAIISRASDELNIVQLSGGWDSTLLIAVLRKYYGKEKVKAAIMELILPNGKTYNPYEIEKSKEIAKYFDIDADIIKVHFCDDKLIDLWEDEIQEKVVDHDLHNAGLFPQFLSAKYLKERYGENVVVFNGEACDSLTNFGFAQYHSISHDNKGFCEYADKMMCYLHSPSFFKKVLNNTFKDDFIFRMFKWYFKDFDFIDAEKLTTEDRIFEYLLSFVYSAGRVPFMQLEKSEFIKEEKIKEFKDWLRAEYFEEVIMNINVQTFYYWLLRIYLDFHLQNPGNIRKVTESLPNIRIPFLDYNLFKFFAQMPENWGRGLEINNVKYPLKRMIEKGYYEYPIKTVESLGPHSYTITESDAKHEYIHNSVLPKYFLKNENLEEKCEKIFSESYFDKKAIKRYVEDFKGGGLEKIHRVGYNLLNFLMQAKIS